MEKNQIKLFITLEEHLQERYKYIIDKYNFKSYNLENLKELGLGTSFSSIKKRIQYRRKLREEYIKLKDWILNENEQGEIVQIYLSNVEGYIAHNIIKAIKKDFPTIECIGLQHGVFEFSLKPKSPIRKLINIFFKTTMGIYPLGVGFGGKIVDKYIVYSKIYKDFLINEFNWDKSNVEVNLGFLKAELLDQKKTIAKDGSIALFLTQCLSKSSLCSSEVENYLNEKVISYLIHKHDKVLIKRHPACTKDNLTTTNPNVTPIDDLIEAFNMSTHAYSYSSTTLIEAELFDIESYAINSSLVKEDKSVYKIFKNVIDFDNEIDI
ncbi:polysialyltransferase family glycosyltransferase [Aquimarina sp. AU58]|uniref:polysialyltransferase family glycosyltransferase n=1 Tax=Aquimarina sp. AU58 TaxID=1874112 RepID=UPI000D65B318|nr:polysialyltransferase family glycosyltransferase [Aquimarina sp. AU58]